MVGESSWRVSECFTSPHVAMSHDNSFPFRTRKHTTTKFIYLCVAIHIHMHVDVKRGNPIHPTLVALATGLHMYAADTQYMCAPDVRRG